MIESMGNSLFLRLVIGTRRIPLSGNSYKRAEEMASTSKMGFSRA
jgi:hypothetical protein